MEAGCPTLIWERWTLPMYRAQLRYWGDNPRLDQLARAYFKIKPKKTPPPRKDGSEAPRFAAGALTAPLTEAEMSAFATAPQIKR